MDKTKFENIIVTAMPKLQGIARKVVGSFRFGDAQDLLQDCLLRMLLRSDMFDEDKGNVCVVAYVVMNNIQITEYNRRKMLRRVNGYDWSSMSADDDILGAIQTRQMLAQCNNEGRLCYLGYSVTEIAKAKGYRKSTIVNHLNANVPFLRAETGYWGEIDRRQGRMNLTRRKD